MNKAHQYISKLFPIRVCIPYLEYILLDFQIIRIHIYREMHFTIRIIGTSNSSHCQPPSPPHCCEKKPGNRLPWSVFSHSFFLIGNPLLKTCLSWTLSFMSDFSGFNWRSLVWTLNPCIIAGDLTQSETFVQDFGQNLVWRLDNFCLQAQARQPLHSWKIASEFQAIGDFIVIHSMQWI